MFTGIIETIGTVTASRMVASGRRFTIDAGVVAEDASVGASIAVNGVCLTVTGVGGASIDFDAVSETLERSNLKSLACGHKVNLERSLKAGSRLDGHFVQGHVDGTASVSRRDVSSRECVFSFRPDAGLMRLIVPKGSVAIDGVSLTIADVKNDEFSVAIVPTTLELTTIGSLNVGDRVNIETDILVRTIVHHLGGLSPGDGRLLDTMREHGYL